MRKLSVLLLAATLLISGCAAQAKPADVIAETQKALCLVCMTLDGQEVGRGSAFVVGNVLVTAAHCVADVDSVSVRWGDKELTIPTGSFTVERTYDIAVAVVPWNGILEFAGSAPAPNEWVATVNYEGTALVGVSGAGSYGPWWRADISVVPGYSGAPLVNSIGRVVGVISGLVPTEPVPNPAKALYSGVNHIAETIGKLPK